MVDYSLLAVLAVVPMVATRPGTVSDDTKTYLYLDPGRYVRQAVSAWDPSVALGTVTHQNIGYLLPMGPFYWAHGRAPRARCGSPSACGWACLLFAAGAGALYLCRTIGLAGPAAT